MTVLRPAPFLTGLRVSSLPLWLTWCWFTSRSLLVYERRMPNDDSRMPSFLSARPLIWSPVCMENVRCFFVSLETSIDSVDMENAFRTKSVATIPHLHRNVSFVVTDTRLSSRCLLINCSDFQASCHNTLFLIWSQVVRWKFTYISEELEEFYLIGRTPFRPLEVNRYCRGTRHLHQGRRINRARNSRVFLLPVWRCFSLWPWKWR
jgi:hypothetical protein